MDSNNKGILFKPAIKGVMGRWSYYVSTMTYYQIWHYVKRPDEIYKSKQLSDMIQRKLSNRYKDILEYLQEEPERFFNAIVLAVYEGETKWHSYEFNEQEQVFRTVGLLEFNGGEKIFPIDGQHRVEAIKRMVDKGEYVKDEEVPVVFISHDPDNVERTRRVFTTLNRYAKPVGDSDIIALDEDDIVAITTRYQVERFQLFKERIKCTTKENMDNDNSMFMSIVTVYKCNESLLKAFIKERGIKDQEKAYRRYRKDEKTIEDFYCYCCDFWNCFVENNSDIKQYFYQNITKNARSDQGGNLLFRPYALKAYVSALVVMKNSHDIGFQDAMKTLSKYSFELNSPIWNDGILWDSVMVTGKAYLIKNIFIYLYDKTLLREKTIKGIKKVYMTTKGLSEEEVDKKIFGDVGK